MKESTRKFFLSINITFLNGYGMSETSGATSITDSTLWTHFNENYLKETGQPLEGIDICIENQDKDGKG